MELEVFILVFAIISTKAIINHNPVKPGCPAVVNPKENLTLNQIAGVWYEIQRLPTSFERGKCVSVNISLNTGKNSSVITITHRQKINQAFREYDQNATFSNLTSVWSIKYDGSIHTDIDGHLYLLETNYANFAVAYACGVVNSNSHSYAVWILSRNQTLQPEFLNKSLEALKFSKIITKPLMETDQTNCI